MDRATRSMHAAEVTTHLLERARWSASRSSGPGGQHRDKASTRAELTLDPESLDGLAPEPAALLRQGLGPDQRPLRIAIQDERSLARNQELAAQRLAELVAQVLAPPPPRRPARPERSAREARPTERPAAGRPNASASHRVISPDRQARSA